MRTVMSRGLRALAIGLLTSWLFGRVTDEWLGWGASAGAFYLVISYFHSESGRRLREWAHKPLFQKAAEPMMTVRDAQRRMLGLGLELGGGLVWSIRSSALETISAKDAIEQASGEERKRLAEQFSREVDERWRDLHQKIDTWQKSTGELIEDLYGGDERALFESEAPIPVEDSPRFDVVRANYEANLHSDVQKNLHRLHGIIERHRDD